MKKQEKPKEQVVQDKVDFIQKIRDERKSVLAQTPEERSKNTGLFKMYYEAIKGSKPSLEEVQKIEELQKQYFEKYPQKCFTNYLIFNKVVFPDGNVPNHQKLNPFQMGVLRLVGNVLNQDVVNSKYGH